MSRLRIPRTVDQATGLLARFADVSAEMAGVEAARNTEISRINAAADAEAAPLKAELEQLEAALQSWFSTAGKALLPKGRKSMELGGCMVGSRAGRASLTIAGEEQDVVAVLSGMRWAKPLLRVKTTLNRATVLSSLDGTHKVALAELGLSHDEGEEKFFIEPVQQPGTISA